MKYSVTVTAAAVVAVVAGFNDVQAWTTPSQPQQQHQQQATTNNNNNMMSRKSMLQTLVQGGTAAAATVAFMPQNYFQPQAAFAAATETLPSGVSYEVVKSGTGPKPDIGELVAIRFSAYYGDKKIDDIFGTYPAMCWCVCARARVCVCVCVCRFQSLFYVLFNLSALPSAR